MKKINFKRNKMILSMGAVALVTSSLLFSVSCYSNPQDPNLFRIADLRDPYLSTVTVNNPTFSDTSNAVFFQSIYTSLVSWKTTGNYTFNNTSGDLQETPKSSLVLEAAMSLKIITNDTKNTYEIDRSQNSDGVIDQEKAKKALLVAKQVEFTLNPNMKWLDTNGVPKQTLAPKDFLYGLKSYYNSSTRGLNSNSYFMQYAGIDYEKTIAFSGNDSVTPGGKFTFVIGDSKSPYFLDLLTKQYFFPVPYSHPEVLPTIELNGPIRLTSPNGTAGSQIDKTNTDWNRVFGSGSQQQTNPDAWYVGPYYLSKTSLQDIVFSKNNYFFDANKSVYGDNNTKINDIVLSYGNTYGTFEKIFRSYTTKDLDFVAVQNEQLVEAYQKYRNSPEFHQIAIAKQKSSLLVTYNTQIYNKDGSTKSKIGDVYKKFIEKWNTSGLKIRKAINGVINYPKLAEIVWNPGKYDFIMSSVPYGNLDYTYPSGGTNGGKTVSQYQAIVDYDEKTKTGVKGALSIPFKEMLKSTDFILNTTEAQNLIKEMNAGLDDLGATTSNPLRLDYRTLIRSFSVGQLKFNEELIKAISSFSGGRIVFNLIPRTQQSVDEIFYNANGPMGSFSWSADYVGAGTYLGYYFSLDYYKSVINGEKHPDGSSVEIGDPVWITEPTGEINDGLTSPYYVTSLWKPLFDDLFKESSSNTTTKTWLTELKDHLTTYKVFRESSLTKDSYKKINAGILDKQIGIWADLKQENAINLSNWVDNQYTFIPYVQEGLDYKGIELYPARFNVVHSLNSNDNYRDWGIDLTKRR